MTARLLAVLLASVALQHVVLEQTVFKQVVVAQDAPTESEGTDSPKAESASDEAARMKRNLAEDTREYRPGGDPTIPHPGTVPNMNPELTSPPPVFEWQMIAQAQRITGQFNTIEVDANDPDRVFVGTEESTIVRSTDGGVTWRELELAPFTIASRQVQVPTRPSLNGAVVEGLVGTLQPPGSLPLFENARLGFDNQLTYGVFPDDVSEVIYYADDADEADGRSGPFPPANTSGATPAADPGAVEASYVDVFYIAGGLSRRDTLLTRAVLGRKFETSPIRMIAVCPGNDFSVFAVTFDELYGSTDGGITWVRLMRIPGNIKMSRVRCSRENPKRILVATNFGLFYSSDGGNSFDQELTARPGEPAYAVNFGNKDATGNEIALVGLDVRLFRGHPDRQEGLQWAYPNFDNPETAPWKRINSVVTTPDGQIWLATADGLRVSRDNGKNWEIVAPYLFNGHPVYQVLASGNEHGKLRIAVFLEDFPEPPLRRKGRFRNSFVYATDDGGKSWYPWFVGVSRRRVVWMAATPFEPGKQGRWFIATGGEVWATHSGYDDQAGKPTVDEDARRWAKAKMRKNPPIYDLKEIAFDHHDLSREDLNAMWRRARNSGALVPDVRILGSYTFPESNVVKDQVGETIKIEDVRVNETEWSVAVQARWFTFDLLGYFAFGVNAPGEDNATRAELYELRRQIDFIVEDAWRERVMLLDRLIRGMTDNYQIAVIRERIELLELTLEFWTGQPLPSIKRRYWTERK